MQKTQEYLKYQFSEDELKDASKKLAYENQNFDELEDAKKALTSEFTSKINSSRASISKLSSNINNGYEYRYIECEITMDAPETGQKTITRTDTGEIVRIEEMSDREMQGELPLDND